MSDDELFSEASELVAAEDDDELDALPVEDHQSNLPSKEEDEESSEGADFSPVASEDEDEDEEEEDEEEEEEEDDYEDEEEDEEDYEDEEEDDDLDMDVPEEMYDEHNNLMTIDAAKKKYADKAQVMKRVNGAPEKYMKKHKVSTIGEALRAEHKWGLRAINSLRLFKRELKLANEDIEDEKAELSAESDIDDIMNSDDEEDEEEAELVRQIEEEEAMHERSLIDDSPLTEKERRDIKKLHSKLERKRDKALLEKLHKGPRTSALEAATEKAQAAFMARAHRVTNGRLKSSSSAPRHSEAAEHTDTRNFGTTIESRVTDMINSDPLSEFRYFSAFTFYIRHTADNLTSYAQTRAISDVNAALTTAYTEGTNVHKATGLALLRNSCNTIVRECITAVTEFNARVSTQALFERHHASLFNVLATIVACPSPEKIIVQRIADTPLTGPLDIANAGSGMATCKVSGKTVRRNSPAFQTWFVVYAPVQSQVWGEMVRQRIKWTAEFQSTLKRVYATDMSGTGKRIISDSSCVIAPEYAPLVRAYFTLLHMSAATGIVIERYKKRKYIMAPVPTNRDVFNQIARDDELAREIKRQIETAKNILSRVEIQ